MTRTDTDTRTAIMNATSLPVGVDRRPVAIDSR